MDIHRLSRERSRSLHQPGADDRDHVTAGEQTGVVGRLPRGLVSPAASNLGSFTASGSFFDVFKGYRRPSAPAWTPGSAVFQYANDQRATTLWYHDHTLGMTRQNVYAGPAGFYLLRGGPGVE